MVGFNYNLTSEYTNQNDIIRCLDTWLEAIGGLECEKIKNEGTCLYYSKYALFSTIIFNGATAYHQYTQEHKPTGEIIRHYSLTVSGTTIKNKKFRFWANIDLEEGEKFPGKCATPHYGLKIMPKERRYSI